MTKSEFKEMAQNIVDMIKYSLRLEKLGDFKSQQALEFLVKIENLSKEITKQAKKAIEEIRNSN